jgi:hypothetical protein
MRFKTPLLFILVNDSGILITRYSPPGSLNPSSFYPQAERLFKISTF